MKLVLQLNGDKKQTDSFCEKLKTRLQAHVNNMKHLKGFLAGCVSEALVTGSSNNGAAANAATASSSSSGDANNNDDSTALVFTDPNILARCGLGAKFGYIDGKRG